MQRDGFKDIDANEESWSVDSTNNGSFMQKAFTCHSRIAVLIGIS